MKTAIGMILRIAIVVIVIDVGLAAFQGTTPVLVPSFDFFRQDASKCPELPSVDARLACYARWQKGQPK